MGIKKNQSHLTLFHFILRNLIPWPFVTLTLDKPGLALRMKGFF